MTKDEIQRISDLAQLSCLWAYLLLHSYVSHIWDTNLDASYLTSDGQDKDRTHQKGYTFHPLGNILSTLEYPKRVRLDWSLQAMDPEPPYPKKI